MNETIPYFYIIQHMPSGRLYVGSRWKSGCCPEELMKPHGYLTSSSQIWKLIEADGIESFDILLILTDVECNCHVNEFESYFLQSNNIASDPEWINLHNNESVGPAYGTLEFVKLMNKKYGVDHASQLSWVREKTKKTLLEKTGYDCNLKDPRVREKAKVTLFEKTGYDNASKDPTIKERKRKTFEQTSGGYPATLASPDHANRVRKTLLEKTGYEYVMQNPKSKEKAKQTLLSKTGYDNPSKDPKVKQKVKQTMLKNHGVEYALQSPEILQKIVSDRIERTGYAYPMQNPEIMQKSQEAYKNLRSRDIVKCISYFLHQNNLLAKNIPLSRRWAIQSEDKLLDAISNIFCCYPRL